ncbi:ATP:ADP antiporter, partial [Rhizoctonia solani]
MDIYHKLRELIAGFASMSNLSTSFVPPWDNLDTTIAEDCKILIERALNLWRHAAVSSREDYIILMKSRPLIAELLQDNTAPGPLAQRLTEVELLFGIAEMLSQTHDYNTDQLNTSGAESSGELGCDYIVNRDFPHDKIMLIHSNPQVSATEQPEVGSGHWVHFFDGPRMTVKDIILQAYKKRLLAYEALRDRFWATSMLSFGILDNPTFHNMGDKFGNTDSTPYFMMERNKFTLPLAQISHSSLDPEASQLVVPLTMFSRPYSALTHIFLANNPRIHVLVNLDPQPQLYTLVMLESLSQVVFKDQAGALHFFSDIWVNHNSYVYLNWDLYRLRYTYSLELVSMKSSFKAAQTSDVASDGHLQTFLNIWKYVTNISMEWQASWNMSYVSWLIEINESTSSLIGDGAFNESPQLSSIGEDEVIALAEGWGCKSATGYLRPFPIQHEILGNVHWAREQLLSTRTPKASRINKELGTLADERKSIGWDFFVVDISNLSGNFAEHNPATKAIKRSSKYNHRNVLSLSAIRLMPGNGIGLVFPQTNTKSLYQYLETTPGVDRLKLCTQISSGLHYLHQATVFVSLAGEAMVSDPFCSQSQDGRPGDYYSRARWTAPEVIVGGLKSFSSDVYSLGMEVMTGTTPYKDKNDDEVWTLVSSGAEYLLPDRPNDVMPRFGIYTIAELLEPCSAQEEMELSDPESELFDTDPNSPERTNGLDENDLATSFHRTKIRRRGNYKARTCHARDVVKRLARHGCENLTEHVDEASFSEIPVSGGAFGNVFRGSLLGGLPVSIKTPRISPGILDDNPNLFEDVAREIHTWSRCHHANIVNFLGLVVFRGQIGAVAPWMEHGNLRSYLKKKPDVDRYKVADVCEGVAYLHEIGIIHGDLKAENVFVSDNGAIVVGDFGSSLLNNRSLSLARLERSLCPTLRWSAPELFEDDAKSTRESDVYALGMVCYLYLTVFKKDLTKSTDNARELSTTEVD